MARRRRRPHGGLALLSRSRRRVCLAAATALSSQRICIDYEASRMSMACEYAIEAYGRDADALPRIVDEAFDEVDRIDRLMSHYKTNSPLSRINREAAQHPVAVEPELFDFIVDAMRYHRDSDGAFDITVGPLMKAWGFFRGEGRVPPDDELAAARRHVGGAPCDAESDVEDDRASMNPEWSWISEASPKATPSIASSDLLRRQQIAAALISAGGSTIYGLGAPPGADGWEVSSRIRSIREKPHSPSH